MFTGEHYEKIQKVYSIWICPSTPSCRKNGMFRYHTIEEPVFGDTYVKKENYDLMEIIVLNLGESNNEADCGILNLLNTLFSPTILPEEKKKVLSEKYNIAMTAELESEVQRMCNLSTAIENRARDEGIEIGELKKAKEMALKLYKKGNSIEEIAELVGISVPQVEKWLARPEGQAPGPKL